MLCCIVVVIRQYLTRLLLFRCRLTCVFTLASNPRNNVASTVCFYVFATASNRSRPKRSFTYVYNWTLGISSHQLARGSIVPVAGQKKKKQQHKITLYKCCSFVCIARFLRWYVSSFSYRHSTSSCSAICRDEPQWKPVRFAPFFYLFSFIPSSTRNGRLCAFSFGGVIGTFFGTSRARYHNSPVYVVRRSIAKR